MSDEAIVYSQIFGFAYFWGAVFTAGYYNRLHFPAHTVLRDAALWPIADILHRLCKPKAANRPSPSPPSNTAHQ